MTIGVVLSIAGVLASGALLGWEMALVPGTMLVMLGTAVLLMDRVLEHRNVRLLEAFHLGGDVLGQQHLRR